jgi:tripartite ATP-independent transporter DctP family solute receptor
MSPSIVNPSKRFQRIVKSLLALTVPVMMLGSSAIAKTSVKMCYNGPPDIETNAVHTYAVNFKKLVETKTQGEMEIILYPNSQLGNEEQRMEQTMSMPYFNVASYGGVAPVFPEMFAANIPFMFSNYKAAHFFFDQSAFWEKAKKEFRKRTGTVLLEAVEEGGFLAFTNSKREIHSPADFKGLKFRAMDESQVALYKAFNASSTPIPWTEVYMALKTGVADGQMNPPMYIMIGSLQEVQNHMTMANIQYSDQFLLTNGDFMDSLSPELQTAVKNAAHEANLLNRIDVESKVSTRVDFIRNSGVKVIYPTPENMLKFQTIGQPSYIEWMEKKIDRSWIDLALQDAAKANKMASTK